MDRGASGGPAASPGARARDVKDAHPVSSAARPQTTRLTHTFSASFHGFTTYSLRRSCVYSIRRESDFCPSQFPRMIRKPRSSREIRVPRNPADVKNRSPTNCESAWPTDTGLNRKIEMQLYIDWKEIALRLACTVIGGALIGIDRGEHGRAAGLRTNVLVCLAA